MTELKARIRGDKRRHLEYAGFEFYQVDNLEDDNHAKWIVKMPNAEYLTKAYVHLTTAISAAERQIQQATLRYKHGNETDEEWQAAARRYEAYPDIDDTGGD